ncbi:MAG TPA: DUF1456 family protein, partial [Luteimonas sp.]|nr:DUF1456 family protein [Luteimonas sp.]
MINNDILRSLRYMLDLGDHHIAEVIALADPAAAIDAGTVRTWLLRDDDPGFVACPDAALSRLLDGLVLHFRGRDDSLPPRAPESRITNNLVL